MITIKILRQVIKTPVNEIRKILTAKEIEFDVHNTTTWDEISLRYSKMADKVVQEIYAENLEIEGKGFITWEPELECGETYENVKSIWAYHQEKGGLDLEYDYWGGLEEEELCQL